MDAPQPTAIELPPDLQKALDAAAGAPPELIDPRTQQRYVLVRADEYQPAKPAPEPPPAEIEIPEGIRRSWAALRRDLPELLTSRWTRGRWVHYRGDERVAIRKDYPTLLREAIRRGFDESEYVISRIEPGAAIEEEEIDRTFVEFDEDDLTS